MSTYRNNIRRTLRNYFRIAAFLVAGSTAPAFAVGNAPANDNRQPQAATPDASELQSHLTAYLKAHPHPLYDRIVVMEPEEIDRAAVHGASARQAVEDALAEQGYRDLDQTEMALIAGGLAKPGLSPLGRPDILLEPGAWSFSEARLCVLVPAAASGLPDYARTLLSVLGTPATVEFLSRHEGWHCKDHMPTFEGYRNEAFADVAATGDMVRAGRETDVIDAVSGWRTRAWRDADHWTSPALAALKKEIGEMGLRRFRALDDEKAARLYTRIADDSQPVSDAARNAFLACVELGMTKYIKAEARTSADARQGLALAETYAKLQRMSQANDDAVRESLRGWDAAKTLRATAGGDSPDALLAAYAALQDGLRQKMAEEPFNLAHEEKAAGLRTAFLGALLHTRVVLKRDEAFLVPSPGGREAGAAP